MKINHKGFIGFFVSSMAFVVATNYLIVGFIDFAINVEKILKATGLMAYIKAFLGVK